MIYVDGYINPESNPPVGHRIKEHKIYGNFYYFNHINLIIKLLIDK